MSKRYLLFLMVFVLGCHVSESSGSSASLIASDILAPTVAKPTFPPGWPLPSATPQMSSTPEPTPIPTPTATPGDGILPIKRRPKVILTAEQQAVVFATNALGLRIFDFQLDTFITNRDNLVYSPVLVMRQALMWGQTQPVEIQHRLMTALQLPDLTCAFALGNFE